MGCVANTPLEDHLVTRGLLVKREDLSCPPPGPPFSKTRGVFAHVKKKVDEGVRLFGVLDTYHSQAGHAVALACREYGVACHNFFPVYKADYREPRSGEGVPSGWLQLPPFAHVKLRDPQLRSNELNARLIGLPAGRSAILFHQARRETEDRGGYMMPNALKLRETVDETALEVRRTFEAARGSTLRKLQTLPWIVASSSGTIAAGVLAGLMNEPDVEHPRVIVHMGYHRSHDEVRRYIAGAAAADASAAAFLTIVDEGYAYADQAWTSCARYGEWAPPPWPANPWYDLKAYRWWETEGLGRYGEAVLWNIG